MIKKSILCVTCTNLEKQMPHVRTSIQLKLGGPLQLIVVLVSIYFQFSSYRCVYVFFFPHQCVDTCCAQWSPWRLPCLHCIKGHDLCSTLLRLAHGTKIKYFCYSYCLLTIILLLLLLLIIYQSIIFYHVSIE